MPTLACSSFLPPTRHSIMRTMLPIPNDEHQAIYQSLLSFVLASRYRSTVSILHKYPLRFFSHINWLPPYRSLPPYPHHISECEKGYISVSPAAAEVYASSSTCKGLYERLAPFAVFFRCKLPSCRRGKTRRHRQIFMCTPMGRERTPL